MRSHRGQHFIIPYYQYPVYEYMIIQCISDQTNGVGESWCSACITWWKICSITGWEIEYR